MFTRLKSLLLPLAIAAAVFGGVSANATTLPENRVGGYQLFDAASRPAAASQVPELQRGIAFGWYDTASECSVAAKSETVIVRHYTDTATRGLINESGNLRAGSYVTLPSEIRPGAGHLQIEDVLEINAGRGSTYIDVPTPASNLRIPANGPTTSGGAWQRQLIEPTPVDPNLWRRPPGRPAGGG